MKDLWNLFFAFCRVGALTFGGGYAMLPMLQREVVDKRGWATEEQMVDYYAIGQCTPGVIAVNVATFTGYRQKGVAGAIFATVGVVLPSVVIITVIAAFIQGFSGIPAVRHAFAGIRVAVCALILQTVIKLWKGSVKSAVAVGLFGAAFVATAFLGVSPIWIVVVAALLGVLGRRLEVKAK